MSLIVRESGGNFERCPAGVHLARCYRIIDIGTQKITFKGESKFSHQVMFSWEVHGKNDDGTPISMRDGRPYSVMKTYTLSWSQKANLRLDLQSWRGKEFTQEELRGFDLKNVLGVWCQLNVMDQQSSNGNTYSNVKSITPVPSFIKQQGMPEGVNKLEMFNIDEPNLDLFATFSDNLKNKIQASPEWQRRSVPKIMSAPIENFGDDDLDDIPF
jgi:hypothetical protein